MFVKGADGEVAKFWPYDYYATGAGGHIDIRYDLLNDDNSDEDCESGNYDCADVCDGYAMVDDCGVCSDNYYCYDYVTHQTNTDQCDGPTEMLVMPDSDYNQDWNSSCTDCAGSVNGDALVDDCGDCQQSYCYDYVTHTVSFDADYACDGATEMSVAADSPSNPYWNAGCNADEIDCAGSVNGDALVDDCGDCQQSYCYDYVTHTVSFDSDYACDGATEMSVA